MRWITRGGVPSVDRLESRDRERQPLDTLPAEVDLDAGVGALTLDRHDHALAESRMSHALADPPGQASIEAFGGALAAGIGPAQIGVAVKKTSRRGRRRREAVAALAAAAALETFPGGAPALAKTISATGPYPRGQPFEGGLGELVDEARAKVVAGLAVQHPSLNSRPLAECAVIICTASSPLCA